MVAIRSTRSILGAALAALLAACKGTEPSPVPTTVVITPAAVTFDAINATQQLAWTVQDQNGLTMDTVTVTWSSANAAVAIVTPAGVVQVRGVGATTVRATVTSRTSVSGTADVSVTQVPAMIHKIGGDAQTGAAGRALPSEVTVLVNDRLFNPISGASVNFAVTQGAGSVAPTSGVTGANGRVSTTWTLGTMAGSAQQMTSTVATGAGTATFNATVVAGPAANMSKQAGDSQTAAAGTPVAVPAAVLLRDEYGNLKGGAQVTFAIASGGGNVTGAIQTTNASGVATVGSWILGFAGENTLTATVPGVTGSPTTFTATALAPGAPASIAAVEGDNQTGLATYVLNVPPAVVVRDASNNPVGGVAVDFAVASGGGTITGASATTDITGVARVGSWAVQLGANKLTATATGSGIAGNPVTLTATGVTSSFTIELQYLSGLTASQQAAFTNAKNKWETLTFGDLSDISFAPPDSAPAATCGANSPAITDIVDDVRIFVTVEPIDGPGRTLGGAGPCYIRTAGSLPIVGRMLFDDADIAALESNGLLEAVILHEMGHVIGIGTVWPRLGLLADATSSGGLDPHFTGAQALAAFDKIGGTGYTGGQKVPVENQGGPGTRDAHWRETVFGGELMTGFVNSGANPLSVVTTASLADEGYLVNYAASDAFTLSFQAATRAGAQTTVELKDDVLRQPIYVVDRRGRVVRVIQP